MRRSPSHSTCFWSRGLALLLVALVVVLAAASFAAATTTDGATPDADVASPSPSPSPSPTEPTPEPTAITCVLSKDLVVFGTSVEVSGLVTPAVAGQEVAVNIGGVDVVTTATDASGAYAVEVVPHRSGAVVARVVVDGTLSDPQAISVKPKVTFSHGAAVPFLSARVVVNVAPAAYDGLVSVRVVHRGDVVGTYRGRPRDGRVTLSVPLRGIDGFTFTASLPASKGLVARTAQERIDVPWRRLSVGSTGAHVKGMLTAFQRLKIRVPGVGTRLSSQCGDAVMAFQKAYRLSRSYVFDHDDWRRLDGAKTVRPRHASPSLHIEVDKTRQILMVVKNGAVAGLICVSTGATGNTPEGAFHIQQKHPYTTSGYGGILFRTMGFLGDFAIHGYAPVPPYPASHGCIREPMWVADWVYNQSFVGERVYVYR